MWRPGQVERCAFCGRTIEPGEERVGRGESAAHAACADAGLGDDRLWEGVGGPETAEVGGAGDGGPSAGPAGRSDVEQGRSGGGCAGLGLVVGLIAVALVHLRGMAAR